MLKTFPARLGTLSGISDALICLMMLFALILRIAMLIGPVGSDDMNYFHYSQQLLHLERFQTLHHHGGRLFFLTVIGVPAALLGSVHAGAILNVVCYAIRDIVIVL